MTKTEFFIISLLMFIISLAQYQLVKKINLIEGAVVTSCSPKLSEAQKYDIAIEYLTTSHGSNNTPVKPTMKPLDR